MAPPGHVGGPSTRWPPGRLAILAGEGGSSQTKGSAPRRAAWPSSPAGPAAPRQKGARRAATWPSWPARAAAPRRRAVLAARVSVPSGGGPSMKGSAQPRRRAAWPSWPPGSAALRQRGARRAAAWSPCPVRAEARRQRGAHCAAAPRRQCECDRRRLVRRRRRVMHRSNGREEIQGVVRWASKPRAMEGA